MSIRKASRSEPEYGLGRGPIVRAFLSGMAGGAVMTLFMAIGRASGVPFAIEMVLGVLCDDQPGLSHWLCGFGIHLLISGFVGIVYATGFELVTHRAGWRLGIAFSVAHTALEWTALTLVSRVHPLAPEFLRTLTSGESAFVGFALVHMIFGAVVGALYAPTPAELTGALFERRADPEPSFPSLDER
jgi:hypothetical protein